MCSEVARQAMFIALLVLPVCIIINCIKYYLDQRKIKNFNPMNILENILNKEYLMVTANFAILMVIIMIFFGLLFTIINFCSNG